MLKVLNIMFSHHEMPVIAFKATRASAKLRVGHLLSVYSLLSNDVTEI